MVISWMLNSMDEGIARSVTMLKFAKKIWDTLRSTYGNEKNIARVCEIYEQLFTYKQGDRLVQDFYNTLRTLLNELEVYQPLVTDIFKMREYREELAVAIFLAGLQPDLANQILRLTFS